MFLAINEQTLTLIILGICIIPIIILMGYAIYIALRNSKRRALSRDEEIKHDEDHTQRDLFIRVYGGKDNIISVTREMSRINVKVKDIEKVLVDDLKGLGANGVLLMNDVVKCSFGDRSSYIVDLLNQEVKDGKAE